MKFNITSTEETEKKTTTIKTPSTDHYNKLDIEIIS